MIANRKGRKKVTMFVVQMLQHIQRLDHDRPHEVVTQCHGISCLLVLFCLGKACSSSF